MKSLLVKVEGMFYLNLRLLVTLATLKRYTMVYSGFLQWYSPKGNLVLILINQ